MMSDEEERDEPLSAKLGVFGSIDNVIFRVEVVIVVTALVLMSIMVFTDVAYQLVVTVSQYIDKGAIEGWTISAGILGFIALMAFAATGDNRLRDWNDRDRAVDRASEALPGHIRVGIALIATLVSIVLGIALLTWESSTIYRLLLIALAIPIGLVFHRREERKKLTTFAVAMVLAYVVFGKLPTGYSWAQSYSLVMLLWVGFLGASIAARQRRHLRVDLARKLMPPDKLPWFNAVSYLVAAAFTATVLYLGYEYIFGPDSTYIRPVWDAPDWLPETTRTMLEEDFPPPPDASLYRRALHVFLAPTEPGALPDWLKVAAIPVSMGLVCLRFLGHVVVFARMGIRGESFTETTEAH
jgi:TRAP-type C4-dicarboxylate transport system permease small subunit